MNDLELIWKLHQHDMNIRKIKYEIKNMPLRKELKKLKLDIEKEVRQLKQNKAQLDKLKKQLRKIEMEYKTHELQVKDLEKRLYSGEVTSVKELEQLEKKLKKIKNIEGREEDETLELVEVTERLENIIKNQKRDILNKKELFTSKKKEYKKNLDHLNEKLFEEEYKREELMETMENNLKKLYNEIKNKKDGIAIAAVAEGKCSVCRMSLPIMTINEVKKKQRIIRCENCGRILYFPA